MRAGARRKRHSLTLEKFFSAFTIYELVAAGRFLRVFPGAGRRSGGRRRSCRASFVGALFQRGRANIYTRADESGRHPILFCNQIIALLGDRNNRDGVRLDFHFQAGLAGDVT